MLAGAGWTVEPPSGQGQARERWESLSALFTLAVDHVRRHPDADLPDLLAVEMEGAALAQVCTTAGVPFALARTISDRADDEAHLDFPRFLDAVAAPYAHDLVLGLLAHLPAGRDTQ